MELFVFARFRACTAEETRVEEELLALASASREQPGCVSIHAFRSVEEPKLFYIHSRWADKSAFDYHLTLLHTIRFLAHIEPLVEHPFEVVRTARIG